MRRQRQYGLPGAERPARRARGGAGKGPGLHPAAQLYPQQYGAGSGEDQLRYRGSGCARRVQPVLYQYYQNYCDIMDPVLMAYSPDGENILLAVYDDGPSGDPLTSFFRYDESGLHQAGSIPGDLRNETIDDERVIHCSFRGDMIQTQWAWGHYYWNGSEIVRREDEV